MANRLSAALAGLALTAATALPQTALAYDPGKGAQINPISADVFEVVLREPDRVNGYWCAAARYARETLGMDWLTTLYVARGLGPSVTTDRRSAVHFTLNPQAVSSEPDRTQLSGLTKGTARNIQRATSLCQQPRFLN